MEVKIYEFLKSKGQLENIDETLIKNLIFNIEVADACMKDVRENGHKINITQNANGVPYWNKNVSITVYNDTFKNINTCLINLGLTVKERTKLKMAIEDPDNFDAILGS